MQSEFAGHFHVEARERLCEGLGFEDIAVAFDLRADEVRSWWLRLPEGQQKHIKRERMRRFRRDARKKWGVK